MVAFVMRFMQDRPQLTIRILFYDCVVNLVEDKLIRKERFQTSKQLREPHGDTTTATPHLKENRHNTTPVKQRNLHRKDEMMVSLTLGSEKQRNPHLRVSLHQHHVQHQQKSIWERSEQASLTKHRLSEAFVSNCLRYLLNSP